MKIGDKVRLKDNHDYKGTILIYDEEFKLHCITTKFGIRYIEEQYLELCDEEV